MDERQLLEQAEEVIENAIRADAETGTLYTLRGIGFALVAIGRLLVNIKEAQDAQAMASQWGTRP